MKLNRKFYLREDVLLIARELLGKYLITDLNGEIVAGMITETEAYRGPEDKASHAYGGRHTPRTSVMFHEGGVVYVYLCYGIHSLFNVVTNKAGIPHAVLIRAVYPTEGLDLISQRTGYTGKKIYRINGPGIVSKAFGIHYSDTGASLMGNRIFIEDRGIEIPDTEIAATPRIGVDYAGEDAMLPYRFLIGGEKIIKKA